MATFPCPHCGETVEAGTEFCPNCGNFVGYVTVEEDQPEEEDAPAKRRPGEQDEPPPPPPEPEPETEPEPEPEPQPTILCPTCGTQNPETRSICLRCGSDLRPKPEPAPVAPQPEEPDRGVPVWLLVAGGLTALLAGLVIVLLITGNFFDGDEVAGGTSTTTSTTVATTTTTTAPTTTTTAPTTTTTLLIPEPTSASWTVILHSMGTDEFTEQDAIERALSYEEIRTGVLLSSDYSSLNPDYWVVFSELFPSEAEAEAHVEELRELGLCGSCYSRLVSN